MARPTGVEAFELAVRNPALGAAAILMERAEERFLDFVRLMWPVTDPAQPLRVGRAMEAIAEHLEAVHRGQIRNLLINCPPGFSKSSLVNVFFPAWEWGPRDRADLRFISWAYGEHLTLRDNEKCQKVINSPAYRALWGSRFAWDKKQNEKGYYKNSREGFRIASGVRGMGTGERGDRLIVDDPHNVMGALSDADIEFVTNWFAAMLTSRVRNANPFDEVVEGVLVQPSATIVIMQRLAHNDVSGLIIEHELPGWTHLLIEMEYEGRAHPVRAAQSKKTPGRSRWQPSPIGYVDWREAVVAEVEAAIVAHENVGYYDGDPVDEWWHVWGRMWLDVALDIAKLADPVRFGRAAVEIQREKMLMAIGTNAPASQFRQYPHEGTGDMFKPENWNYCEASEVPPAAVMYDVRGWDLGATDNAGDGTGGVRVRRARDSSGLAVFYVLHAERVRQSPGGVKTFRERIRKMDGPTVIQDFPRDPGQAGVDQVQNFAADAPGTVTRSSPETGSKIVRASPFSAMQEHRRVYLVRAPWNAEYVEELGRFPHGTMTALVDASSRAFNRLASMPSVRIPGGTEVVTATSSAGEAAAKIAAAMTAPPRLNPNVRGRAEVDEDLDADPDL